MAEKKDNVDKKSKGGDEGKKDEKKSSPNTVILKIDMHCEGCASKIIKCAKAFEGVEKAKVEWEASKLTVEGKVDPAKLRDGLQQKTKKKVELVSPQPKKDKESKDDNTAKNNDSSKGQGKKAEEKKPKEPPVTTAILKIGLHCQGCVQKIHKFLSKTSGVKTLSIERQKDLVTVTGTMDVKALAEGLKRRMKREVEVIPQKKGNEKGKNNEEKKGGNDNGDGQGTEKKGGGNGSNNTNAKGNGSGSGSVNGDGDGSGGGNNGNAGKKKKGGGGGGDGSNASGNNKEGENGSGRMEGSRMEYPGIVGHPANTGYGYGYGYGYGHGYGWYTYGENVHAPQYFSDENPNACSVM